MVCCTSEKSNELLEELFVLMFLGEENIEMYI